MKFLLTNDDGVDAPGLEALRRAVAELGEAVVVAPVEAHSGCSHRVTTHQPLRLAALTPLRFTVEGTPADCVRVGLAHVAPEVDWVLSGVNHGGNLGVDVFHSGTVAAVREAALHGKPGIALSHYRRRGAEGTDWLRVATWACRVLKQLLDRPVERGTFWNVNLPHPLASDVPPRIMFCPLEAGPLPLCFRTEGDLLHYSGNYHERHRQPGTDVDVCFSGQIAVSQLRAHS